jgi:hypothetical protein
MLVGSDWYNKRLRNATGVKREAYSKSISMRLFRFNAMKVLVIPVVPCQQNARSASADVHPPIYGANACIVESYRLV